MLKLYNTLTRKKEKFEPLHPPFVGMYVCGPTVYDDPHLGHAKSYISFDIILRYLRVLEYNVRYVQNITDVGHLLGEEQEGEDRILKKARLEKLEPVEVAQKYEMSYFRSMDSLNCLRPDISCRATGHITEMIDLVNQLIKKGFAYEVEGNVYFDLARFSDYGKLSGRKQDELLSGTRGGASDGKRNPLDFALWKRADENHLMQWPSPWGKGFPGWHIECSAMSMKYIGDTLDIHGGGLDNQFPHHECEIAQSEASTGKKFVKYWIHNNMVTVNGRKMSKSLGNFVTLDELFSKYDPMTVRFFVLQGHYRSPQDFSDDALDSAEKGFLRLLKTVNEVQKRIVDKREINNFSGSMWAEYKERFYHFMDDDFNTSGALTVLFDLVKKANQILSNNTDESQDALAYVNALFHFLGENILGLRFKAQHHSEQDNAMDGLMRMVIDLRQKLRNEKQWDKADDIRGCLDRLGIVLEDGKEGTAWSKKI